MHLWNGNEGMKATDGHSENFLFSVIRGQLSRSLGDNYSVPVYLYNHKTYIHFSRLHSNEYSNMKRTITLAPDGSGQKNFHRE